jgi:hypothetical protein
MKVTGYTLKEQIKIRMLELDSLYARFEDQLHAFPGEKKHPADYAESIMEIEAETVLLQVGQKYYNLHNLVQLPGMNEVVPLEHVIKMVGPVARVAKRWRNASKPEKDRFYRRESVRKTDEALMRVSHQGR